jgi:hypothetical protein
MILLIFNNRSADIKFKGEELYCNQPVINEGFVLMLRYHGESLLGGLVCCGYKPFQGSLVSTLEVSRYSALPENHLK